MTNNSLGEKIKYLRKKRALTQKELVGDRLTRNMLSSIENGTANPSLDTLRYIADRLSVPVSYILSEDDDPSLYEKSESISKIYRAYEAGNYTACIALVNSISNPDCELKYILASSYLELGKRQVANGSLVSAKKSLELAEKYSAETRLDTRHFEAQILMYLAITANIQSPLLEFDSQKYIAAIMGAVEFELFKYITLDFEYAYETPTLALHAEAKKLMKERNYKEALKRLLNAAELSKNADYNSFVIFGLYTDIEYCYKQLYDYEKAYLYSTKRMTLIEGYKT